jgi:hypothetical protein
MTAQTLAKLALGDAQTQALIGRDIRSTAIAAGALAAIAKYANSIPEEVAEQVLSGEIRIAKEATR